MRTQQRGFYSILLLLLVFVVSTISASSFSRQTCWGCSNIPRGGSDDSNNSNNDNYVASLDVVKSKVLENANNKVEELRRKIIDEGIIVDKFGELADEICNKALEEFAINAPAAIDTTTSILYDRKVQELESAIDSPLHVLYMKLLGYIRESALQQYRTNTASKSSGDYEAMIQADTTFVRQAELATREGSELWDWNSERVFLQAVMNLTADAGRKAQEIQLDSAQKQQTAMSFLQSQQQMIQQLQMQLYGQSSPWNVGIAYRIPDTNFNIQGNYQQGRANIQLSCVPDEYAPMLGPNGFTNGVGPGNLGLSLNLSI